MPTAATPDAATLAEWVRRGLVRPEDVAGLCPGLTPLPQSPRTGQTRTRAEKATVVDAAYRLTPDGPEFVVPVRLNPGDNARGMWQKIGAAASVRPKVAAVLSKGLADLQPYADRCRDGLPVVVRMTRLGGRGLDTDGLAGSLKYVRDTVALVLGTGDGPKGPVRWECHQQPGGPYGVLIDLRVPAG